VNRGVNQSETLARELQVERACEAFEAAWRAGRPLAIEALLEENPPEVRGLLLRELIAIELELRRQRGEQPDPQEYESRFPQDATWAGTYCAHSGPAAPESRPRQLGRYEILEELGRGGFGIVYRAVDSPLQRQIALKVLRNELFDDRSAFARFSNEARVLAGLHHPNIINIFAFGEDEGVAWIAMELVRGSNLADRLRKGLLSPQEAAPLVETLARAVHHAHERGVIHRDLKPSNVLLESDGTPKVTDFFLAKQLREESVTMTGMVVGTPSYMAPEQADGRVHDIGPAADVYALGAILYTCLTGRAPFKGTTAFDTVHQVMTAEPVPPSRLLPQVPRDLETICLKCLRKDPDKRYRTAHELAEDLRRFRTGWPVQARPVPAWERAWRQARRKPAVLVVSVLLVLLLVLGVLLVRAVSGEQEARRRGEQAVAHADRVLAARTAGLSGRQRQAVELYAAAIVDDFPDRVDLEVERLRCWPLSWRRDELGPELDRVEAGGPDRHRAVVQLLRGAFLLGEGSAESRRRGRELIRASAPGLSAADRAYAEGLLADSPADAAAHFQDALEQEPMHPHARRALLVDLLLLGRLTEAGREAHCLRALDDRDPLPVFAEAWVSCSRRLWYGVWGAE
jgi:tRNA A-37 threonylcarbamoyl transferase component Bud32